MYTASLTFPFVIPRTYFKSKNMGPQTQQRMVRECFDVLSKLPRLRVCFSLFSITHSRPTEEEKSEGKDSNGRQLQYNKEGQVKRRAKIEPDTIEDMVTKYTLIPETAIELEVFVWYENTPMKLAHCPRFPKKKTYSWWLLLGDAENDELIQMKRCLMEPVSRKFQKKSIFEFEVPDEDVGQSFMLDFCCLSDSFVGLDQQYGIEITIGGG